MQLKFKGLVCLLSLGVTFAFDIPANEPAYFFSDKKHDRHHKPHVHSNYKNSVNSDSIFDSDTYFSSYFGGGDNDYSGFADNIENDVFVDKIDRGIIVDDPVAEGLEADVEADHNELTNLGTAFAIFQPRPKHWLHKARHAFTDEEYKKCIRYIHFYEKALLAQMPFPRGLTHKEREIIHFYKNHSKEELYSSFSDSCSSSLSSYFTNYTDVTDYSSEDSDYSYSTEYSSDKEYSYQGYYLDEHKAVDDYEKKDMRAFNNAVRYLTKNCSSAIDQDRQVAVLRALIKFQNCCEDLNNPEESQNLLRAFLFKALNSHREL